MQDAQTANDAHPVKRVLVADDNRMSAQTLTWAMELQGYNVKTCYDGASAVAAADDFHPDVVLLDIGMPVMDGIEAARRIRANTSLGHPTLIAQTGWGDAQTRQRTADAGFDVHLTKPVDLQKLWALLETMN